MKKIYLLTLSLCLSAFVFAQSSSAPARKANTTAVAHPHTPQVLSAALGDTLFIFDCNNFYITNTDDQNDFAYENVDVDELVPYNAPDFESDWNFWYSLDANDLMPNWDNDSAFFMSATSWFNPAGQADNWFTFGPITIPAGGANLAFYNKSNPGYTDGIKVFVSTTGTTPYVDFEPTTSPVIFSKSDCQSPCTPAAADTVWNEFSASLTPWADQRVYIAFWHNSNDGDVAYLDQFFITETNNVGIKDAQEVGNVLFQNRPNPASSMTSINYQLAGFNEKVGIDIYDVTGKKVKAVTFGEQGAGKHVYNLDAAVLASGTYYYTLKTDAGNITKKLIVTK